MNQGVTQGHAPVQLQDIFEDLMVAILQLLRLFFDLLRGPHPDDLDSVELVHPLDPVDAPALVPVAGPGAVKDLDRQGVVGQRPSLEEDPGGWTLGVTHSSDGLADLLLDQLRGNLAGDLIAVDNCHPVSKITRLWKRHTNKSERCFYEK
jgi:hypothetical protein